MTTETETTAFVPGDLVLSVYGDGDGSGNYTDNQAAPITLEQVTTTGAAVSDLVLPQTASVVNGTTESAISGEYGSSSEGSLALSADGHSLVIAGYGVNAQTYNAGGAAVYGNAALAQSTSLQGGQYTPVTRVIADISATGVVDTSTALYGVFNTNNPRSVATVNGSSFYVSGQGVSGDATQGVFVAQDGASSATRIDGSTDTRTLAIHDGALYVSRDSKQPKGTGTANVASFGTTLPTTATKPSVLPGISQSITLTTAEANGANGADVGKNVDLSPENVFFANATTLYVADGGIPKEGGLGDGGLQKWVFNGSAWTLAYTLSAGLNLVANTAAAGSTGLIGLTGVVSGNTVQLYVTNATINDLDPTFLYGITDSLGATSGAGESFTTLVTATTDTNIRGVAFAPTAAAVPCYCTGTLILTARGEIAVEALAVGDLVATASGVTRPVRWIGHRRLDLARHPEPAAMWPVQIRAGAFGEALPRRDLWLSPGHNIAAEGVLMPALALVNGRTVVQHRRDIVEYWHVELDAHDVILAEGLPAESYLDTGNRTGFANGGAFIERHPDFAPRHWAATCLPLVQEGPELDRVRVALHARAEELGNVVSTEPGLHLVADGRRIEPVRLSDTRVAFMLPTDAAAITLYSHRFVPSQTCPPSNDPRLLGVCVGRLQIDGESVALDDARLAIGWHACEDGVRRWTDGAALLPVGARLVVIDLASPGNYWLTKGDNVVALFG